MPEPLTESLLVHWHPTLRYHQHRLDILAQLEADGLLREFRVTGDDIGARTAETQLTLTDESLVVFARAGLASDQAAALLRLAFEAVLPSRYHISVFYQYVVPIANTSYSDAKTEALASLSDGILGLGATDFAFLVDGKRGASAWQCEFGIVSQEEMQPRIRREVGRTGRRFGTVPPFFSDIRLDTPVGFFADMRVGTVNDDSAVAPADGDAIISQIKTLRADSDSVVSDILGVALNNSLQPVAGGPET